VLCQLNCVISKVSFFYTLGVAGVLETSSIGKRRRPGCDPVERSPGQVAVLLRGFFCRPLLGSLFWHTFFSMLRFRRCCFFADFEHGGHFRDQLHWKETPAWPFLVHLFSLHRVLGGTWMHSHVGISDPRIGVECQIVRILHRLIDLHKIDSDTYMTSRESLHIFHLPVY